MSPYKLNIITQPLTCGTCQNTSNILTQSRMERRKCTGSGKSIRPKSTKDLRSRHSLKNQLAFPWLNFPDLLGKQNATGVRNGSISKKKTQIKKKTYQLTFLWLNFHDLLGKQNATGVKGRSKKKFLFIQVFGQDSYVYHCTIQ